MSNVWSIYAFHVFLSTNEGISGPMAQLLHCYIVALLKLLWLFFAQPRGSTLSVKGHWCSMARLLHCYIAEIALAVFLLYHRVQPLELKGTSARWLDCYTVTLLKLL